MVWKGKGCDGMGSEGRGRQGKAREGKAKGNNCSFILPGKVELPTSKPANRGNKNNNSLILEFHFLKARLLLYSNETPEWKNVV